MVIYLFIDIYSYSSSISLFHYIYMTYVRLRRKVLSSTLRLLDAPAPVRDYTRFYAVVYFQIQYGYNCSQI